MATTNKPKTKIKKPIIRRGRNVPALTHGGAIAVPAPDAEAQLRRSVLSCLLWEDEHYESGQSVAKRIAGEANAVDIPTLAKLAVEARSEFKLRHVPLLLLKTLVARGSGNSIVAETIRDTIQRPDDMVEFVALYWADGKKPLSAQMKKGLSRAFQKFDAYQLAKYDDQEKRIQLRDVMFLCHAKPKNRDHQRVLAKLKDRKLPPPDTWESQLVRGADKKETFTRLLHEGKLGYMALLRNLRGMDAAGVSQDLITKALVDKNTSGFNKVLPFRFISAARHAPQEFVRAIDRAMQMSMDDLPRLAGRTVVVVDVSGSMMSKLSGKSELSRLDAAAALVAIAKGMAQDCRVFATAGYDSTRTHKGAEITDASGLHLIDAVQDAYTRLGNGGIFLTQMTQWVQSKLVHQPDRLIVITDEQDCDSSGPGAPSEALAFGKRNYLINVASAKNGIGYGPWLHIDGFSEQSLKYIAVHEAYNDSQRANLAGRR